MFPFDSLVGIPRGTFGRIVAGLSGLALLLISIIGIVSEAKTGGIHGHGKDVVLGLALAAIGLGMLLTAILRKGNEVPFDW